MKGKRIGLLLAAFATLVAWLPCLGLLASLALAALFHCRLDEASIHPCVIAGSDRGRLLSELMIGGGWLTLVASPLMVASVLFWLGWLVIWIVRRTQRLGA